MKVNEFDISRYDDNALKHILWQLCYNPFETAFKMGFGECNEEDLKKFILSKAKEEGRLLDFACEAPVLETYGVDMGIKNPIVRDYIIEKCHAVALKDDVNKILRLLKTEERGDVESSRKIHGGLREMDLLREEASYIQETCNVYPIYLLLQRITQDLINTIESSYNYKDDEPFEEEVDLSANENDEPTDIVEVAVIENKVLPTISVQELIANGEVVQEAMQLLERLEEISELLKVVGISLEYVSSKKNYLNALYNAIDNLNN